MKSDTIRRKVFLALWQIYYDLRLSPGTVIQRKQITNKTGFTDRDVYNALRFLHRTGYIRRSDDGYGWIPTRRPTTADQYCWRHGMKKTMGNKCPKCI